MLSKELKRKQHILRVLSYNEPTAILLELHNARERGIEKVSHLMLETLVLVLQHETFGMQGSLRELVEVLGIVEKIVEEGKPYGPETISYRLNPNMDSFSAALIALMFTGEQGMRASLPPEPKEETSSGAV